MSRSMKIWIVSLLKNFCQAFIDDLSSGSDSVVDAFQLFLKSKLHMQEAGFRVGKWASNSEELVQMIKDHEISHEASFNQNSLVQEEDQSYMITRFCTWWET